MTDYEEKRDEAAESFRLADIPYPPLKNIYKIGYDSGHAEGRLDERKRILELLRSEAVNVITEWKHFWMNQTQNSEADYQNYLRRSFGIDANMKHNLADRLVKFIENEGFCTTVGIACADWLEKNKDKILKGSE